MKKQKRNLVQRIMVQLVSAILLVSAVSNEVSFDVMAQQESEGQEAVLGDDVEVENELSELFGGVFRQPLLMQTS